MPMGFFTVILLSFSFFTLFNGKRNTQFIWAAIDTRLNDNGTTAFGRASMIRSSKGVNPYLT